MKIDLYFNNDDKVVLNKNITEIKSINVNISDDIDVHSFQILLNIENDNVNYCYIPSFKRYYFINKIYSNSQQVKYNLECDYLMTYKDEIMSQQLIQKRGSSNYNSYIIDNDMNTFSYEQIVCKKFPSGLNDDSIILMTIG